jgi:hypothetical protein
LGKKKQAEACFGVGAAGLFRVELLAQATLMFRAYFIFARSTGLLVQFAALRINSLGAISGRHFLLHALAESRASLPLAFFIRYFAGFALLRVGCLAAIKILMLVYHALLTIRAGFVLAGFSRLQARVALSGAGLWIWRFRAVSRRAGAGAALPHHLATLLHTWPAGAGGVALSDGWQAE